MATLQFEVRVVPSPELAAHAILQAARAVERGDRAMAQRGYRALASTVFQHPRSWSNLAALAIGMEDAAGARRAALRALQLDQSTVEAWVNLGVASWMLGQRRDAAQATHRALELEPGAEAAALNYARMLSAVRLNARAFVMLGEALALTPGRWRLHNARSEAARLIGDAEAARRHALRALALLAGQLDMSREEGTQTGKAVEGEGATSTKVQGVLFAVQDVLDRAGLPFHLIGGTLLAVYRDGRLFPHDKDVDLGLPFICDRDAVEAAFAGSFKPMLRVDDQQAHASREWVMGYTHEATGIGVDLMFVRERDGIARFELGWPDHLACEMPVYPLQSLHWAGRDWQVPAPPERYLSALYGPDWSGDVEIRGFDRRWFDTQVSNPSRTPDSLPRAVNLALLRLLDALHMGQWAKARALCIQILAREQLEEVRAMLLRLDGGRTA